MSIRIKEMPRHELLKRVLYYEFNLKDIQLIYSENGKPSLVNKKIYFNLSSSRNISALVTSSTEVGICIKHYFFDKDIIDLCFNQKEKEIICKSCKKEFEFTKIYTLKVAYLKMFGFNKDYPLINIDTTTLKNWQLTQSKDYIVAVIYNKKSNS